MWLRDRMLALKGAQVEYWSGTWTLQEVGDDYVSLVDSRYEMIIALGAIRIVRLGSGLPLIVTDSPR